MSEPFGSAMTAARRGHAPPSPMWGARSAAPGGSGAPSGSVLPSWPRAR